MNATRDALIGLDMGSTHVKAMLLASPGAGPGGAASGSAAALHVARRPTVTHSTRDGGSYYEPAELLGSAMQVLAECAAVAGSSGHRVVAIGIASIAESGVPMTSRGRPLGEILAWFDPRPEAEAGEVASAIGADEVFRRTGLRSESKYTLPKLLWWRRHRPAAYARLSRWAGVAELVAFELTGALATNASLATRTLAFDCTSRRWDGEMLALARLTPDQMPAVLPLGVPAGGLAPSQAPRLGLRSGIPVAVAGHDHIVAGLGAGVGRPGDALDSTGSAEVALLVTPEPVLADAVRTLGFSSGSHARDDAGYILGALQSSASAIEWFINRFIGDLPDDRRYGAFMDLMQGTDRPGHVLVQPYLRTRTAPYPDHDATLAVSGMLEADGPADLAAAIVDGAAFHVQWMFDELEQVTGIPARRIRVTGGGIRNDRWMAAKAALAPGRIEVVRAEEAGALGAALVAGIAGGLFASIDDALTASAPAEPLDSPGAQRRRYERAYRERWLPWVLSGIPEAAAAARYMESSRSKKER